MPHDPLTIAASAPTGARSRPMSTIDDIAAERERQRNKGAAARAWLATVGSVRTASFGPTVGR